MDWSRTKNILIGALLVCNIILGFFYIYEIKQENDSIIQKTEDSISYLSQKGYDIEVQIPIKPRQVKSIYVSLTKDADKALKEYKYKKYDIEVKAASGIYISGIKAAASKVTIKPAYYALFKYYDSVEKTMAAGSGKKISEIKLVYRVDRMDYKEQTGEDTALPYWKITDGSGRSYYYMAIGE